MPKRFNSLHQMVNCLSRGVAASDLVNFGISRPPKTQQKLTMRRKGAEGEKRWFVAEIRQ
jgi:hypothetical protein